MQYFETLQDALSFIEFWFDDEAKGLMSNNKFCAYGRIGGKDVDKLIKYSSLCNFIRNHPQLEMVVSENVISGGSQHHVVMHPFKIQFVINP